MLQAKHVQCMEMSIKQLLQRSILTGSEYLDHCAHLLSVLWLTHLEAVASVLSNELLFVLSFAELWEHRRVPSTKASVNASVAPKAMASLPLQMEGLTSSYTSLSKSSGWPRKAGALVCHNYWMLLTFQIQEWFIICHPYLSKEELCRCYWQW